ncbi:MAG: hypothetical protein AAF478_14415 [Pseudomonadota bacterium]
MRRFSRSFGFANVSRHVRSGIRERRNALILINTTLVMAFASTILLTFFYILSPGSGELVLSQSVDQVIQLTETDRAPG